MPDNREAILAMLDAVDDGVYRNQRTADQELPKAIDCPVIAGRDGPKTWFEIARNAAIILLGKHCTFLYAVLF
jgi:hypothetical protein